MADSTPDIEGQDLGFVPQETPEGQDLGFVPNNASESEGQDLGFVPNPTENKYGTTEQQIKAGLEGAAQGFAGPLAPLVETHLLGVDPEDIKGRAQENPLTHGLSEAGALVGGMLTGTGEAGLIAKAVPEFSSLGRVGSLALKGAIDNAAIQGGDEISKYILNEHDPETPVASALTNMGMAGLLGGATGGIFGAIDTGVSKGLQALEDSKLGTRVQSWLAGYGAASRGETEAIGQTGWDPVSKLNSRMAEILGKAKEAGEEVDPALFKAGMKFHTEGAKQIADTAIDRATEAIAGTIAYKYTGLGGGAAAVAIAKQLEPHIERIIDRPITKATQKYIMPLVTKVLTTGETKGLGTALNYATKWDKGARAVTSALDSVFKGTGQQLINSTADEKNKKAIEKYMDEGGLENQIQNENTSESQGYAEGGKVEQPQAPTSHLANLVPDQAMMLSSAKGRVYNYLNQLKPRQPVGQLPYDKHEPTAEQKRVYDNALNIAANPLSIMKHVKDGTLTNEHVKHFTQMWPEISSHLSKKITERIVHGKMRDEKPNYKTRQSLSMLMGMPLESSFTPSYIQAAQSTYAAKAPQQPAQGAPKLKRGTAKLGGKTNKEYQTADQNAELDRSTRS